MTDAFLSYSPYGATKSIWMETPAPEFKPLNRNITADVTIIGAGIVGLTCAYTLAKQGKNVVIVDQGPVCCGQTSRTTGHLTWALDDRYYDLEKYFGLEGAQIASESHNEAINYIENIVKKEGIECDFERLDAYLFVPPGDSVEVLTQELKTLQRMGMNVTQLPNGPYTSFNTGPCIKFPNQGQFHVLKYAQGLIKAILNEIGEIYTHTHVVHIEDGPTCSVITENGQTIKSKSVIVATCTPINNRFIIHTKQAPYRTYVIGATVPKGSIPKCLSYDTSDPYHYIRIQKHETDENLEWLLIGGEDHRVGEEKYIEKCYQKLESWAKKRFPIDKFEYHWSGQIFEPVDSLGFIGRNPGDENIYIATGDSGNGITHGTIAGILIPDLILGKVNPWEKLYSPTRKTLSALPDFITENANTAWQYRDWFTPGELKQIDALPVDKGMILSKGIQKLAVYRDQNQQVHIRSAKCPHLGACVRWNDSEKSWDCPAHGSRFNGCGGVINGPAINSLS